MSQSDSESEIWEYKSLKKKKREKKSSNEHEGKRRRADKQVTPKKNADKGSRKTRLRKEKCSLETRNTKTRSTNPQPEHSPTQSSHLSTPVLGEMSDNNNDDEDGGGVGRTSGDDVTVKDSSVEGHCPVCQMPFSLLLVQSQRWHVTECLENPPETNTECPDGLQCKSFIPNHYKRYSHFLLAHSRAINGTDGSSLTPGHTEVNHGTFIPSKDSSVDSAVNLSSESSHSVSPKNESTESHTPVRPNALLLLRSPAPADIKKKKGWSPSTTSKASSQEAKIRMSTPVKVGPVNQAVEISDIKEEPCALNNEDYISYSPLSELPIKREERHTKKKLFYSTTQEETNEEEKDDDSLTLFDDSLSDDDLFSDMLDQYETQNDTSPAEQLTNESVDTCDQLDSSQQHEGSMSFSSAGAADGPSQFSSPVRISKDQHLVKDSDFSSSNPQLQSPQSLVLERLRKHLSNSTDCHGSSSVSADNNSVYEKQEMSVAQGQAVSVGSRKGKAPGLKQTDIGVFFGLKPLREKAKVDPVVSLEPLQVSDNTGKRAGAAERKAKHQGRRQRKTTEASEVSTTKEDGAVQPTQTEGGRRVRTGGRGRWNRGRATDGEPKESKRCPFYKKIPGTGFAVDAFQYGCVEGITAYFLTHFHSDHYGGLNKNSTLPVYCNKITGNLVKSKLKVPEQYIHVLPMNKECIVNGVKVILLDANHCPGAAMLLFMLPDGQTVLHTGDFRADPSMERYPELQGFRVQTLYLDTTYCSPEYAFPSQQEVITFAANTAFELVTLNPRTLVVCGTYSVGKEKVFLAISQVLGSKVYMSREKYNTMCCLESDQILQFITSDIKAAHVHVLPMMQLNFKKLKAHLDRFAGTYDQLVAFKPTGWTFTESCGVEEIQPQVKGNISIYGIPYSEHSSYLEMKRFVQWLRPLKIIPTVNVGSWRERRAMEQCFNEWQTEVKTLKPILQSSSANSYTRQ